MTTYRVSSKFAAQLEQLGVDRFQNNAILNTSGVLEWLDGLSKYKCKVGQLTVHVHVQDTTYFVCRYDQADDTLTAISVVDGDPECPDITNDGE